MVLLFLNAVFSHVSRLAEYAYYNISIVFPPLSSSQWTIVMPQLLSFLR